MTIKEQLDHPPWRSIALLSMTALAYEILLMRLFSIVQWHHFAYMIISLALLGYGASGTFLSIYREKLLSRYQPFYIINIALFALSTLACFLLSQKIQFNAEEILWDNQQIIKLMTIYLLLALPFFFTANAIGLTLIRYHKSMTHIYAADLFGAGIGGLLIIVLLFAVFPDIALRYVTELAVLACLIASWELYKHNKAVLRFLTLFFTASILIIHFSPQALISLEPSSYKSLSQAQRIIGSKVVIENSSPLGMISVVENKTVPLRHAPGLSLNSSAELPDQVAVFIDGDAMTAITHDQGSKDGLLYTDQLTSALPYHLSKIQKALVLGSGGGAEVLQAKNHNVKDISAVELNKQIVELVKNNYSDYTNHVYDKNKINLYINEARGFIASDKNNYDLIQLVLFDSFGASAAGMYALNESYLYTLEAFQQYLSHLRPEGYLSISRWLKIPPRDTLKLFTTAIEALKKSGVDNPENHLILIRSLQTTTLLVKKTAITQLEIDSLIEFSEQRSFDVSYYPGISVDETNRYNMLSEPYFHMATTALLSDQSNDFIDNYKFNLKPATDDKPFFFQFFKWRVLPEIVSLLGEGGMPLLEWGYLILVATLAQAFIASLFLIILPLVFTRHNKIGSIGLKLKMHSLIYFLSIGLSFLFIEIAFIQKFILFLHHPVFAIAVVLAAFLIFAGIGSLCSKHFVTTEQYGKGILWSITGIVIIGINYALFLDPLFTMLISLPITIKIFFTIILIAPLAFCMGMPFPLALTRLGYLHPVLVPWVWGINGCASVLSAVLATLLAIHFGFTAVILLALLLYMVAAISSKNTRCFDMP